MLRVFWVKELEILMWQPQVSWSVVNTELHKQMLTSYSQSTVYKHS